MDGRVVAPDLQRDGYGIDHVEGERIQRFWPIERNPTDAALALGENRIYRLVHCAGQRRRTKRDARSAIIHALPILLL